MPKSDPKSRKTKSQPKPVINGILRTQWEYRVEVLSIQSSYLASRDASRDTLDSFGAVGWELVGITHSDVTRNCICIFKRELGE